MRKFTAVIIALIFILSINFNATAAMKHIPATLRCVVPYDNLSSTDKILYTALKNLGIEMTIDIRGEENGIKMTHNGERDMIAALPAGAELDYPGLVMIPEVIGSITYTAYGRKDASYTLNSWKSLEGLRVGTLYQRYHINKNIPSTAVQIKMNDIETLKTALSDGTVDVIVTGSLWEDNIIISDKYKQLGIVETVDTYAYVKAEHNRLTDDIQAELKAMKSNGSFERIMTHANKNEHTAHEKNVLLVTSYYDDTEWDQNLKSGVNEVFAAFDDIALYTVSLNANRILDTDNRETTAQGLIRNAFPDKSPDIIILSDNAALEFVARYYKILFDGIPVVFCGINGYPTETLQKLRHVSTGLLENVSADETMDFMLSVFPETKNVFVINDFSETGIAVRDDIKSQLARYEGEVAIEYNEPLSLEDLRYKLRGLSPDTLVLVGRINIDGYNKFYKISEMQSALSAASSVPLFGLVDSFFGYGQIGGKYVDAQMHGRYVAQTALNVLSGADLSGIPIRYDTGAFNRWIFDYSVMKKYSITEDMLPGNYELINNDIIMGSDHEQMIMLLSAVSLLLFFAFLAVLFYLLRTLKRNQELQDSDRLCEIIDRETEITTAKSKFNQTLNSAPLVYMLLADDVIIETNQYFDQRIAIKKGVVITPDDENYDVITLIKSHKIGEKQTFSRIIELPDFDGKRSRFNINIVHTKHEEKDAIIVWGVDVEESEQQKDRLERSKLDLQQMLDLMPTPITVRDIKGNTLYVNKTMIETFGFKSKCDYSEAALERFFPEFQTDGTESKVALTNILNHFTESDNPIAFEWIFSIPDKPVLYTQVNFSTILYDNEPALLCIIHDISAEKMKTQLLTKAAEKEREANNLKSRFLMNISHEMRTPMNAIIGLSQMALQKPQTSVNTDTYKKINSSAKNLLTIINDILDFSKIEAEKLSLVSEEFILEDVLSNALVMAAERIVDKNVHLHLDISPDVPYMLIGDRTRTWQVVKNILDNSAKFTDEGMITLSVSLTEKTGAVDIPNKNRVFLKIEVEDTGCGMDDMQLSKLFTPFEQFGTRSDQIISGTGLGMSITSQIINVMHGEIDVRSKPNIGTIVTLIIPFDLPYEPTSMAQYSIPVIPQGKKRILVHDTDTKSMEIITKLLKYALVDAFFTSDIDEAIKKETDFKSIGEAFDLVIIGSLSSADKIHKNNPDTTILLIRDINNRMSELDNGHTFINDFIERPFVPSVFYQKLFNIDYENKPTASTYCKFKKANVLICEDNIFNQEVAHEMLQIFGIEPIIVNNGSEGIDMLNKMNFDMVFMDLQMPVMDGYEATAEIRNGDYPFSKIPIVAMTANVGSDVKQKCMDTGMNEHVSKPLDLDDLNKVLMQFMPVDKVAKAAVQDSGKGGEAEDTNDGSILHEDIEKLSLIGINAMEGIKRYGGKTDKYYKLLNKFADSISDEFLDFDDMFSDENFEKIVKKIQTLKNTSGNLGVTKAYNEIAKFEMLLNSKEHTRQAYEDLLELCEQVKLEILTNISND